ncbi:hypothetical protein JY742_05515 [Clostridioides difficile]|nr:hypothetical protein [Clostridioides difficile]
MITAFKTKEEREKEVLEKALNSFSGIQKDRAKVYLTENKVNDRLFLSNLLVKYKFEIRDNLKDMERIRDKRREYKSYLKQELGNKTKIKEYINYLEGLLDSCESLICAYGNALIPLFDSINKEFTKKEICQLIGANEKILDEYHEFMKKHSKEEMSRDFNFIYELIFVHHGEYRWRKGRYKDFVDCPDWEMPLFNALWSHMDNFIENNKKIQESMHSVFDEVFGDTSYFMNSDGTMEKSVQEINIKELISNYRDYGNSTVVFQLKRKSIIDITVNYKLKRQRGNVVIYKVFDSEDNELGEVHKII